VNWIGLPLALVSAVIVSWAYVREQGAVTALCTISLSHPLSAVRVLVRTRAWQPLPHGARLDIQLLAYGLVVVSAALLVRVPAPSHIPVPAQSKPGGTFDSKRSRRQPHPPAVLHEGGARR
jgi:hypothetical protein